MNSNLLCCLVPIHFLTIQNRYIVYVHLNPWLWKQVNWSEKNYVQFKFNKKLKTFLNENNGPRNTEEHWSDLRSILFIKIISLETLALRHNERIMLLILIELVWRFIPRSLASSQNRHIWEFNKNWKERKFEP